MSLLSPSPTFLPWKGIAILSRLLLWMAVVVWVMFVLTWGAIHWVIVPRIGEWRSEMETLATRSVGIPVRLGSIRAQSESAVPTIEIDHLRLLDAGGRDALVLRRVVVSLSVRSIWRLGFEQVLVEQPDLDIRRTREGRIRVAGLEVMADASAESAEPGGTASGAGAEVSSAVADWLFSQPEFALLGGRIHWTDEWHRQAPVMLDRVNFVLRNPGRRHLARLDAVPSGGMGQAFSLRFHMRSPLLSLHPGQWRQWSGEAYGEFPGVDLARLAVAGQMTQALGLKVHDGQGALRLWMQMQRGQVVDITSDLALQRLHASWRSAIQPLELRDLAGRIQMQQRDGSWEIATQGLNFRTPDGVEWVDGAFRVRHHLPAALPATAALPLWNEFEANHINLAAVRELALGLPLPRPVAQQLSELEPQGTVEALRLRWQDSKGGEEAQQWSSFHAQGRATGLSLKAQTLPASAAQDPSHLGRPGFKGASVEFEVHQAGGQARFSLAPGGQLEFPGVFDEAVIPMSRFSADARWTLQGDAIQVELTQMRFANADMDGQAQLTWKTGDPTASPPTHRFPGVLQLDGQISRGKGERVYRYLPRGIPADVRQYVKESVLSATTSDVKFRVAGDLYQFPFHKPTDGEFRIQAKVHKADYAYIPPSLQPSGALPWPAFRQLEGVLRFDRLGMNLEVQRALIDQAPGLRVVQGQARIADFQQPVVEVQTRIEGSLAEALRVVHRSPLADMTQQVLRPMQATGNAHIQFGLNVPLLHTQQTTVRGQVSLAGNDVQFNPDTPLLGRVRGAVEFSQEGFSVPQASARLLGAEVQFSGGMSARSDATTASTPLFKGQGVATAEGLRQAGFLGAAAALAEHASGQTPYTVQLAFPNGQAQVAVQSSLQGLALHLPAPLNKPAEQAWPLQLNLDSGDAPPLPSAVSSSSPSPSSEIKPRSQRLSVHLNSPEGPRLNVMLQRDAPGGAAATAAGFSRGLVRVGAGGTALPSIVAKGWALQVQWPELNADAWADWFHQRTPAPNEVASGGGAGALPPEAVTWPERVWLRTDALTVEQRRFHGVDIEAQRHAGQWLAKVQTREVGGRLEYRAAQKGRSALLKARLDKWTLQQAQSGPPSPTAVVAPTSLQATLPDLDVEVEALEMDGRAMGRLELQAANQAQPGRPADWQLNLLKLRVPEAELSATGRWGLPSATAPATGMGSGTGTGGNAGAGGHGLGAARRTELDFKLDVQDSGLLLRRFGMPGVFKGGKGALTGHIGWTGAPVAFNTQTLSGRIELDVAAGQFLKADPGLAKLLGVLSLQSLPRRLTLDFTDVFAQGFSFDFIRGDARIQQGVAFTNNLQMKGVNAAVLMEGVADIGQETQDVRVWVVPEINAGTASLIATVINPAVGLGTFLAQAILRQPLIRASTQEFRVHGPWVDPQVEKITASTGGAP